jgi:hypothetical protein
VVQAVTYSLLSLSRGAEQILIEAPISELSVNVLNVALCAFFGIFQRGS